MYSTYQSLCLVLSCVRTGLAMRQSPFPLQEVLLKCQKGLTVLEVNFGSKQARGFNS